MLTRIIKTNASSIRIALFVSFIVLVTAIAASGQMTISQLKPVWPGYKGATLGMTADEVKTKFGEPKCEDPESIFYVISDTENVQFMIDANKKVRAISAVFDANNLTQPTFEEVFGKTADAEPKPDGSVYKLVKYPDAGYWVSFSRMAGDKAMVIVMIQKM